MTGTERKKGRVSRERAGNAGQGKLSTDHIGPVPRRGFGFYLKLPKAIVGCRLGSDMVLI